ncbi:AEC family transporter [Feifania hominis]|uniref:AEC family transporter n=1 Tax=Feifania hominis TaxID=2763660 RepID=A0A926DCB2_9FIRM|nr:AEC family transporter [Feifania hominis]MBC8535252.1 AEC family transporter [Feifania hominis]
MEQISIIIDQMLMFAIMIAIGAVAAKMKVFTPDNLKVIANLISKILLPAMILTLIPSSGTRQTLFDSIPILLASFAILFVLLFLGRLTGLLFRLKGNTLDVHTADMAFGNARFIGLPIIEELYGPLGVLTVSMYSLIDQLLLYTVGMFLLTDKERKEGQYKFNLKNMLNPTLFAVIAGFILLFFNVKMEGVFFNSITSLGGTAKYVAMVYLGGSLYYMGVKGIFKRPSVLSIVAVKLIAFPLLVYLVLNATGWFDPSVVMSLVILSAIPVMNNTAVLARVEGSDHEYASTAIFVTTILFMVTMPLVMYLITLF